MSLYSLPGNNCNFNYECTSNDCFKGKCRGLEKSASCDSHIDCDVKLRCDETFLCDYQLRTGEKFCRTDFDCVNNAGCLNGICTKYF